MENALTEKNVLTESTVSKKTIESNVCFQIVNEEFMKKALVMAKIALEKGEVPVGCVIIHDNIVIADGYNDVNRTKNATRHAEIIALEKARFYFLQAGKNLDSMGECVLYVTTEPCIMCAAALRISGLKKVFYGCSNQRFGGCGSRLDVSSFKTEAKSKSSLSQCELQMRSNLECISGCLSQESINLLKLFYTFENPSAPQPKCKTGRKVPNQND
ncbi:tRNA-specific adenosine deaminase 2 isoform X2 [Hydra vulgaris]|uniref:tRNA-specific adenosine deaminase 2 isoform X2 n=1 Tax=Hydra vulgaris TaxID=6087 RepID=A0ABM4DJF3_HYDVU